MENKHTFNERLVPWFSPSDQLDIKLSYTLAKFAHRAQTRKEMIDGKPTRYFEHVRRVSLILIDEVKIMDRDMIITCLLHDSLEDCQDITPELLEHCFGNEVVSMVKLLSKIPKEDYIGRLDNCQNWKILTIKACDRLDNLRSLMVPGVTEEFQEKQIYETKYKYFPIFDKLVKSLVPANYTTNVSLIRNEIKRLIYQCEITIKTKHQNDC